MRSPRPKKYSMRSNARPEKKIQCVAQDLKNIQCVAQDLKNIQCVAQDLKIKFTWFMTEVEI